MANDNGWIKLYRSLMSDCLWQTSTPETKVVIVTLLMMANHEENEWIWQGKKFKCKPGQMVTSAKSIAANCGEGVTERAVRCALNKLQKFGFASIQTSKTGTLINVVNWGKYQGSDEGNVTQNVTGTSQQRQRNVRRTSTNKNDKNDKNDKNINTGSASPDGEQPAWKSEGFSSEENYIKFLRGEISEPQ